MDGFSTSSEAASLPVVVADRNATSRLDLRRWCESVTSEAARFPLRSLWRELVDGAARAVDAFSCKERCYVVVEPACDSPTADRQELTARNVAILSRALRGETQKTIAFDLGLAPSTIATVVGHGLRAMGFECSVLRVPPLLVMAAHADHFGADDTTGWSATLDGGGATYRMVSAWRPDRELSRVLSEAEQAVARLVLEGRSNGEIARARGTSIHTVANQVASVFQKLGVRSRTELLSYLAAPSNASNLASQRTQH